MARSTKASNAVLRLKERSNQAPYSMVCTSDGLFFLVLSDADGVPEKLCEPLPLEDFVSFVKSVRAQAPKKASKFDLAFEAQLQRSGKH
jgi:hypothetical protein